MGNCCSSDHLSNNEILVNEIEFYPEDTPTSLADLDKFIRLKSLKVGPESFVRISNGSINDYYTFEKMLGYGGFSKVYKATHKATGLPRAIKVLKKSKVSDKQQGELIEEAEILKDLDHPGIAKIFECYEDEKHYYIVSEYCSGGELFDRITAMKSFSEKMAAEYMKEILSAVVYCHSKNIIHRDLKPENILFDSQDKGASLKVIDFGTATKLNPSEKLSSRLGTPFYIAPEVLEGCYDEKCDVWSCGVILYILLCGYPPFGGLTESDTINLILESELEFEEEEWKDISSEAKGLVKKMLTKDPQERISALEALNDSWIQQNTHDTPLSENIVLSLQSFRVKSRFQQAIMAFIASEIMSQSEKNELQAAFSKLDKDKNGRLSKEEIMQGYKEVMGAKLTESELEAMFEEIDSNNSGEIDFNEFIVAAATSDKLLSENYVKQAFQFIDQDGNGYITREELASVMGEAALNDDRWAKILEETDDDGDGKISLSEFVRLMSKARQTRSAASTKTTIDESIPTKRSLESRIMI